MKKIFRTLILCIIVSSLVCSCMVGCGNSAGKYAGTYLGQNGAGSTLILNKDGSCTYSESDTGIGYGTWSIEDDKLIVEVENLNYPIYADLSDGSDAGLYFVADSYAWRAEYFIKQS